MNKEPEKQPIKTEYIIFPNQQNMLNQDYSDGTKLSLPFRIVDYMPEIDVAEVFAGDGETEHLEQDEDGYDFLEGVILIEVIDATQELPMRALFPEHLLDICSRDCRIVENLTLPDYYIKPWGESIWDGNRSN